MKNRSSIETTPNNVLTVNGGSSSIKFAIYRTNGPFRHLLYGNINRIGLHNSGLLGIYETSSDMRDLLKVELDDIRAAEAVELFCYQTKKWIGAFAATLGGIDTLVFSGGIGEKSLVIRSSICAGLEFLGIEPDKKQNEANAPIISTNKGKASVRVIRTDEKWMIAKTVKKTININ